MLNTKSKNTSNQEKFHVNEKQKDVILQENDLRTFFDNNGLEGVNFNNINIFIYIKYMSVCNSKKYTKTFLKNKHYLSFMTYLDFMYI